jgi:capsular polysaccharide biosynthesis protein
LQNSQLNGRHRVSLTGYEISPNGAFDGIHGDEQLLPRVNPIRAIRRRWWMIALVVVVAVAVAAAYIHYIQTPTYKASLKILVGHEVPETQTVTQQQREGEKEGILEWQNSTNATESFAPPSINTELQGLQQLTKTIAEAVETRPVMEPVVQRLERQDFLVDLQTVQRNLQAKQSGETQFIDISYQDSTPEGAQLVANTAGDVFTEQVSELSPTSGSKTTATVWERASEPEEPNSLGPERIVLLALAVGLILGVGLALLLDYFDDRCRSPEEAEQVSGVPVFGVIPPFKVKSV